MGSNQPTTLLLKHWRHVLEFWSDFFANNCILLHSYFHFTHPVQIGFFCCCWVFFFVFCIWPLRGSSLHVTGALSKYKVHNRGHWEGTCNILLNCKIAEDTEDRTEKYFVDLFTSSFWYIINNRLTGNMNECFIRLPVPSCAHQPCQ